MEQTEKDGVDGSSFFNNVRYDDNFVYFTFTDGKVVSIPLSKGVSFTVSNVSDRQLFVYGETRTFDIVQNNIAKISISKPDGWKVSVLGDVMTVMHLPKRILLQKRVVKLQLLQWGRIPRVLSCSRFL